MRRAMSITLAVCLALSAYVALQPDPSDELSAAPRDRRGPEPARARTTRPVATPALASVQPDARQALSDALASWQARHERQQRQARLGHPGLPEPDALTRQAWASQQRPPPPVVHTDAAEPGIPVAPPFPYAWVGRYLDPQPKAIIAGPAGTWVTASGDVLDGQWRIDAIEDRQMTLTYLPLSQSQTVAMK